MASDRGKFYSAGLRCAVQISLRVVRFIFVLLGLLYRALTQASRNALPGFEVRYPFSVWLQKPQSVDCGLCAVPLRLVVKLPKPRISMR